ncbi:DODA-type extradiol aromatic ring-opening family dioxygenase [Methylomonas sp. MgM2]
MKHKPCILFLSHGGGPLPLFGDEGHDEMVACLKSIAADIKKPKAIVVISAHWEERLPTLTSAAHPPLIYDYYGFPQAAYSVQYPCPGLPALAGRIQGLLEDCGMEASLNPQRGFDHGLFVPLKIMYPDADIPCVQLSLLDSLDPASHINMGRALQDLNDGDLLILGSGFSFHNMKAFYAPETDESKSMNQAFESWLLQTLSDSNIGEQERTQRLVDWAQAPYARYCHPREEHLLPLHVCYGLAHSPCSKAFELTILNKKSSMYLW